MILSYRAQIPCQTCKQIPAANRKPKQNQSSNHCAEQYWTCPLFPPYKPTTNPIAHIPCLFAERTFKHHCSASAHGSMPTKHFPTVWALTHATERKTPNDSENNENEENDARNPLRGRHSVSRTMADKATCGNNNDINSALHDGCPPCSWMRFNIHSIPRTPKVCNPSWPLHWEG